VYYLGGGDTSDGARGSVQGVCRRTNPMQTHQQGAARRHFRKGHQSQDQNGAPQGG